MIIRKSCHELEKEIEVPPLGRMNTNAKCRGGLQTGTVVRSVAIDCQHGDVEYDRRRFAQHLSGNRGRYRLSTGQWYIQGVQPRFLAS